MATNKSHNPQDPNHYRFVGFGMPTTTPVPDQVFDELLYVLSPPAVKVLLYIVRRTFGFKKTSDNISLKQMVEGITTKTGKVLDLGTGLSKATVARALNELVAKGVIVRERRQSAERGYEATTYRLNIIAPDGTGDDDSHDDESQDHAPQLETPPLSHSETRHVSHKDKGMSHTKTSLVSQRDIQQTVLQQTVKQETVRQHHGGGAAPLIEFGVSEKAAYRIAAEHAEQYILDKLDQVKWLLEHKPQAVTENPAGYLCRAIRDNFAPPPGYVSPEQRAEEEAERERIRQAAEAQHKAEEEQRQRAREKVEQQIAARYPAQPIVGTDLTTQTGWEQTLKLISERQLVTRAAFATWLKDTRLLWLEGGVATIGCINDWAARYLEQQLYSIITDTLEQVIGRPIEAQFIALEEAHEAHKAA